MPFEEKPVNAVPSTYVPPGIRHPVRTGESWVSIAKVHGIDSWDLIDFNFPGTKQTKQIDFQRATRHVNWYLREYVGCHMPSPDGDDWAFTSGLSKGIGVWKGGVIYIPPRITASPPPLPVWPHQPLPGNSKARFEAALDTLGQKMKASQEPRINRFRCWVSKLKAGGDDRVIQWHRICPRTTGAIGAAYVVGPCDLTAGPGVDQVALEAAIKSVQDLENANRRLRFITHMRSEILFTSEMTSENLHLENFRRFHDEVGRTIDKLDKWASSQMGGSSAMPPAYVSIKDWIRRRQRDPSSVYSCL